MRLNVRSGSDTVKTIPSYGDLETIGYGKDNIVVRHAAGSTPLGAMPLAVLARARPFELPKEAEGFFVRCIGIGPACGERESGEARAERTLLRSQRQRP